MSHAHIPIEAVGEQGRSYLRIEQAIKEIQPLVNALYPGYELQIVKKEDEPISTTATGVGPSFRAMSGPDQIASILEDGPLEKGKLLEELEKRGVGMSPQTLTVYLSRGKRKGRFDNGAGAVWRLKKGASNGSAMTAAVLAKLFLQQRPDAPSGA